jgi:hypothetical protein
MWKSHCRQKCPVISHPQFPLSQLEVSHVIRTWSAPGGASANLKQGSTISPWRLQYIWRFKRVVQYAYEGCSTYGGLKGSTISLWQLQYIRRVNHRPWVVVVVVVVVVEEEEVEEEEEEEHMKLFRRLLNATVISSLVIYIYPTNLGWKYDHPKFRTHLVEENLLQ